jgi:hypothetical protein
MIGWSGSRSTMRGEGIWLKPGQREGPLTALPALAGREEPYQEAYATPASMPGLIPLRGDGP